ncbi:MAG TPA: monovalent cation/H(+) antiporter subunit G [Planctomycetaceae bacterium]|nr:monovalent cation/H(+) antiporter subunit G [Planctomycetaceae bacterium]
MNEIAAGVMAFVGSLFMLLAAIGILRMPDLFLRLQVTSKASVMGTACIMLAVALHFSSTVVTIRAALIICFIVLTVPVATHMLARAGYATNVPLSAETVINELSGQYDPRTHVLAGEEPATWEFEISPSAIAVGKTVAGLHLPGDMLILVIHRRGEVVIPRGQTVIEAHDRLRVLAKSDHMDAVRDILGAPSLIPNP